MTLSALLRSTLLAAALVAPATWAADSAPASAPAASAPATPDCPPQPTPLTAEVATQARREAIDRGYLFKLSKGGRTSWLYGTIHVARLPWMFPGPRVREALQASDQVALELDMLDPEIARRVLAVFAAPADARPLPPTLAERLQQQSVALCAGAELAAFRPEMQAITLSVLAARRVGLEPGYGVDGYLAGLGRQLRKPVLSLETPESQIGVLIQPTPEATAHFVGRTLDELASDHTFTLLRRLAEAWARSDWDDFAGYMHWCRCMDTEEDRALMRRVLDERNVAIAAKVKALHDGGTRLFAGVGSLHLIGPQGLPALLAADGFEVERVLPPPAGR
jgi:uncharacterized protein YbaP (TraB family)